MIQVVYGVAAMDCISRESVQFDYIGVHSGKWTSDLPTRGGPKMIITVLNMDQLDVGTEFDYKILLTNPQGGLVYEAPYKAEVLPFGPFQQITSSISEEVPPIFETAGTYIWHIVFPNFGGPPQRLCPYIIEHLPNYHGQ